MGLGAVLAACAQSRGSESTFGGDPAGVLNFANRPLSIDKVKVENGRSVRPSLEAFMADTGILVNYREVIQESDGFSRRSSHAWLPGSRPAGTSS